MTSAPAAAPAMAGTAHAEPAAATGLAQPRRRLPAIDALRGLVMLFMLVDHVRETFYLHLQVSDPVDANTTDPGLFFTRLLSTFCAPTFVALTGLSAWLYGQSHPRAEVAAFLCKRGLFLIGLELTVIGLAWSTQSMAFPPDRFWLQVIWAIGISMVALAALLWLPRGAQFALGLAIVGLHNLLDGIVLAPGDSGYAAWAVLHQRAVIDLGYGYSAKTTYPVLPWIGVILLGYAAGPWFGRSGAGAGDQASDGEASDVEAINGARRLRRLVLLGAGMLAAFVVLRWLNVYGDKPWFACATPLRTAMSFLALTKYPPSLLFLLPTLGTGVLLLALFERLGDHPLLPHLAYLGGAPMFFYVLHLYVLKAIYHVALAWYGPVKGTVFGVEHLATVWIWVAVLAPALYWPTRWFARLKQRRRDLAWLKYL